MSHRKVLSQGNVPFSWEQKPGVSKLSHPDFQPLVSLHSSPVTSRIPPATCHLDRPSQVYKIPPPPCRLQPRPNRNTSFPKGIPWEEDPFLLAYKECTKSVKNGILQRGNKGAVGGKKSKFSFSCKSIHSCEVRDDSFFKLPKVGKDRIHVLSWK